MSTKFDDFNELEKVKNLFQNVNGLGNTNCILLTRDREYNPTSPTLLKNNSIIVGGKIGGIGGAAIGGLVANSVQNAIYEQLAQAADSLKNQDLKIFFDKSFVCGWLLNYTENGIGFIPLTNDKKLLVKSQDLVAHPESYFFVENQYIKNIELKNQPLNFKKDKKLLRITFNDGENIQPTVVLMLNTKSNEVKFQEENYKEFEKIFNNK